VEIRATPAAGFQFVRWAEDANGDNPRTVTVTQDTTLTARFVKGEGLPTYLIDIRPNNENMGSIVNTYAIGGEVGSEVYLKPWGYDGPGRYAQGEGFEFIAEPADGYHFVRWEINGIPLKSGTEVPQGWDGERLQQHIIVDTPLTIIAVFVSDEDFPNYASLIVIRSNNDAMGTVVSNVEHYTDSGMYLKGDAFEIQAQPAPGYRFLRWERDGIPCGEAPGYYIIVDAPLNLTAAFADESLPLQRIIARTGNGE
jgi:hypothetical protein